MEVTATSSTTAAAATDDAVDTCYIYFFKLAWHGSLLTLYLHVFIIMLAFVDKRYARLIYTRVTLGYVVNIAGVMLGWMTMRDTFSCQVMGPPLQPPPPVASEQSYSPSSPFVALSPNAPPPLPPTPVGLVLLQQYTNPLAYPALDAVLFGVLWSEAMPRFAYMTRRKRMVLIGVTGVGLVSMFWFHRVWHILLSLLQGVLVQRAWGFLLSRMSPGSSTGAAVAPDSLV